VIRSKYAPTPAALRRPPPEPAAPARSPPTACVRNPPDLRRAKWSRASELAPCCALRSPRSCRRPVRGPPDQCRGRRAGCACEAFAPRRRHTNPEAHSWAGSAATHTASEPHPARRAQATAPREERAKSAWEPPTRSSLTSARDASAEPRSIWIRSREPRGARGCANTILSFLLVDL
jgi:hypothetical protein